VNKATWRFDPKGGLPVRSRAPSQVLDPLVTSTRRSEFHEPSLLLVAGAISALGFAPLDLWPLTFLAFALLADLIERAVTCRAALIRAWCFGFGQFGVALNWIATAFTYQEKMPAWLGWIAVIVLAAYLALFPALAAAAAWTIARARPLAFAFVFSAAWMLFELLRAILTGFPWNPIGVLWFGLPWIAQGASWVGTYGLSALAVLVASLFGFGLRNHRRSTVAVALGLLIIFIPLGWAANGREARAPQTAILVRIVQPDIKQDEKYGATQAQRNMRLYAQLSGQPSPRPRILFWPEGATLRLLEWEPKARIELARLLGPRDLLLLGGVSVALAPASRKLVFHNSVFAIDRGADLRWRYDKAHLVPFGEYLPARSVLGRLGLSRLVPGDEDFTPGPGPRTFELPGFQLGDAPTSVGVQICYEIIFSGHVVDERHRPSFLFNPSNDAWFGAWGPPQHLAQARLRAIEEGLPIIRATPNGISALIDPYGRLVAMVPRNRAGVIDAYLSAPRPRTVFSRLGLWASVFFGFGLGAIGIIAVMVGNRRRVREVPLIQPAAAR
jgi:apolipoprotein N-acyltransferase